MSQDKLKNMDCWIWYYLQAIWRPPPLRGSEQPTPPGVNLYPEAVALSKAVALFIKDSDWNTYTLLYDDDQGKKYV